MQDLFGGKVRVYRNRLGTVGCERCPQNDVPCVVKILGLDRIRGRRAMLWAQSPGRQENKKHLELVGPAGIFLWEELARYGLGRGDFDVQNVMRCWPVDENDIEHTPSSTELRCCSIYNEQALERNAGRAVVHLILGEVAGKQLLGDAYQKKTPVFWYEPWEAYVVLAPHPSYILRLGGQSAGWIYYDFRDRLKAVVASLAHPGRWGYVGAQNYGAAYTGDDAGMLLKQVRVEAKAGRRVGVDLEDGIVKGKQVALLLGIGWGRYQKRGGWKAWDGGARSLVLYHPEADGSRRRLGPLLEVAREIMEDDSIRKVFQHGSYDVPKIRELLDMRVRGYDYDSQYAAYLQDSRLRTYSLEAMTNRWYQEFADYKQLVREWSGNYADAPLVRLVPYNCADCDLTKRIEVRTAPHISDPLLQVYIQVAFILDEMEGRGPLLDWDAHKDLAAAVEIPLRKLRRRLCQLAGKADFNPDAHQQVAWLLYRRLRLPTIAGYSTQADVLEMLAQSTQHVAPRLVIRYRKLSRIKSTYLRGYATSAERYGGELRTIWWLTGAATGRLRSGKGDRAEAEGIINFQNLHGNPLLQNLLVSDVNWRLALGKVGRA